MALPPIILPLHQSELPAAVAASLVFSSIIAGHWSAAHQETEKNGRDYELEVDENGNPKKSVLPVEMKAQAVAELEARSGDDAEVVFDSFIIQCRVLS